MFVIQINSDLYPESSYVCLSVDQSVDKYSTQSAQNIAEGIQLDHDIYFSYLDLYSL